MVFNSFAFMVFFPVVTILYFLFFIGMPIYTRLDRVKPVPQRLTVHAHA